ncbi:MAG TPA: ABC transporter ATP-binding protein [Acidimicrobiales bacterium]|nr:ABC transporter ATP-binding protein [Acidimicrobiales bacterium]
MLAAVGLSRSFGGRTVVDNVSFRVAPGEVVGLLGPNGAGKTTTMRMLLGVLRPGAGHVEVGGPIGYLPETFAAYDALTVASYLRFMARMKRVADAGVVDDVAARAGVGDLLRRPVGRLSKGQRQRVGLAQALLGEPSAYVLDEPTQGLDPVQVVEARRLIRALATEQRAAVLVSTHLLAEAASTCDRVVVVVQGRVVAEEVPGEAADLEARFLRLVGEAELA